MVLDEDMWPTSAELANLLDQMVTRREKLFGSAAAVGHEAAKNAYDDVQLAVEAIKAVLSLLPEPSD